MRLLSLLLASGWLLQASVHCTGCGASLVGDCCAGSMASVAELPDGSEQCNSLGTGQAYTAQTGACEHVRVVALGPPAGASLIADSVLPAMRPVRVAPVPVQPRLHSAPAYLTHHVLLL